MRKLCALFRKRKSTYLQALTINYCINYKRLQNQQLNHSLISAKCLHQTAFKCFARAAAIVSAERRSNIAKHLLYSSISAPFGQVNSILRRPANSAQNSARAESQNPGIPASFDIRKNTGGLRHCYPVTVAQKFYRNRSGRNSEFTS